MIKLYPSGVLLKDGREIIESDGAAQRERGDKKTGTIAEKILLKHNVSGDSKNLRLKFDKLASHDITYVNIIQTARAGGLTEFPMPYVLTNCHNSLCAVGGTINEDDHAFGFSAAKKYGGVFVPAHLAVIHQYMRETAAACGEMILGSDSHTRYGALGALSVGEGGGELVKQLLGRTYDIETPEVVGVYLENAPPEHAGPMDVALAIIKAVFANGFVKNKIMEFVGPGIKNLSADFRNGIDVMTTETACLSSIWRTDGAIKNFYAAHGRPGAYSELAPDDSAYYDGFIRVDLSKTEPMIAMPFHPANVYTVREFKSNLKDIVREVEKNGAAQLGAKNISFSLKDKITDAGFAFDQGVIAGCAGGTYENLTDAADILTGRSAGNGGFGLYIYPASAPVFAAAVRDGSVTKLAEAGAVMRSAFCGPCFGASDVPANNGISIRHTTRNFPNREGSKPAANQIASVALADAKTVAATAANGGVLSTAEDTHVKYSRPEYRFNNKIYANKVYNGFGAAKRDVKLVFGPGIADWPPIPPLPRHLLLVAASVITDPVTTTDELIPSGETSSYRSNPLGLAEFTLSRKDPEYVGRAKKILSREIKRREYVEAHTMKKNADDERGDENNYAVTGDIKFDAALSLIQKEFGVHLADVGIGSFVRAVKPGDGSAREQAASCQRVLGGAANIASEYATKRYRSNLINWGILPFVSEEADFTVGDFVFVRDIRNALTDGAPIEAYRVEAGTVIDGPDALRTSAITSPLALHISALTGEEKNILLAGSLINHYSTGG